MLFQQLLNHPGTLVNEACVYLKQLCAGGFFLRNICVAENATDPNDWVFRS